MKSRLTTYMLLAAAIAVWGVIAWKLLSPDEDIPPAAPHARADDTECEPVADTLIGDYPVSENGDAANRNARKTHARIARTSPCGAFRKS